MPDPIVDLENDFLSYYRKSCKIYKEFGGPSVYFHRECIKECNRTFLSLRHIEMIYATLVSWGLHRMGNTKTKLVEFQKFKESILKQNNQLEQLRDYDLTEISENQLEQEIKEKLEDIFFKLKVSESDSKFVSHAKTLHHLLPKLVPPMDREYTLKFFSINLYNHDNKKKQYDKFSIIMDKMRYIAHQLVMQDGFSDLRKLKKDGDFNTSYTKIIDNLIITWIKQHS
jgi:hypothetical protein